MQTIIKQFSEAIEDQTKLHRLIELKARTEHRQELIEWFQRKAESGRFAAQDLVDWIDEMQLADAREYGEIK